MSGERVVSDWTRYWPAYRPAKPMDTNGWLAHGEALRMCNENEWIVREAFLAYDRGDFARMMDFVDPGLRWTYLDPGLTDPPPQVCRGREELEKALRRQTALGLRSELE